MAHSFLETVLMLLAAGTLTVALFRQLHLSPILGYLTVGAVLGPHALGWLPDSDETRLLAEFGVVFLMFTIGLEFSLPRLLAQKRLVVGAGGLQVALGTLLFGLAAWLLGLPPAAAFVTGGAFAMSSTAIVLKQLDEQMELDAPHGRIAVGILLFQDLAAIPFLVILPALAGEHAALVEVLAQPLARAALVFLLLVAAGRWLLKPVLRVLSAAHSLELFMLSTLLVALSAAWLSESMGLSPALGAFMAGMVVGETEFRHQVETDILPFKDLLLGLFFVTIGMQLDFASLPRHAWTLAWLIPALIVGKTVLNTVVARLVGGRPEAALRSGVSLAQGGEFGLLLLSMATGLQLLPQSNAQPLLTALIASMAVAPLLVRFNAAIAARFLRPTQPELQDDQADLVAAHAGDIGGHVIICGFGRVGERLARVLDREGIDWMALELDHERVRQARALGMNVSFGDASRTALLQAAGLARASAVVVSFDAPKLALRIIHQVRHLRPDLPVLVRSVQGDDENALFEAGARVFPEGLEASLMFGAQLLLTLGLPAPHVQDVINSIRAEDYQALRPFFQDDGLISDGP